ncbi:MAG TPA: hypothetical protein QGF58_16705 [Myxococcota bacterium]|nr:hypothetical protein [Myxococcota bacterium]
MTIFDIRVDHEPPFLVMECVAGGSLLGVPQARGPLPPRQAVGCTLDILEGL